MTVNELKTILSGIDRGVVRDRSSYDVLQSVFIEYTSDSGVVVYLNFETEV